MKCDAILTHVEPPVPDRGPGGRMRVRLRASGVSFRRVGLRIAGAVAVALPEDAPERRPFLAAFLGLAPGLGQLYNRQPKKVLFLLPLFLGLLALTVRYIKAPCLGNLLIAATIAVPLISYSDALVTAARINGQYFTLRNRLAALTYPFCLLGLIGVACSVLSFFGWPLFTLFHVRGDYMRPALQHGDSVCGEKMTYYFRGLRPGDVVRYDPPQYRIEIPGEIQSTNYLINPQNGWERVMAVGGETLERRNGAYYVDGRELSQTYYPLVPGQVYNEFKIVCPPGKYLVLISARAVDNSTLNVLRGQVGTGSLDNRVPDFNVSNVIVIGWPEACCVGPEAILDRAWFI